jgi:hypothetical protein
VGMVGRAHAERVLAPDDTPLEDKMHTTELMFLLTTIRKLLC